MTWDWQVISSGFNWDVLTNISSMEMFVTVMVSIVVFFRIVGIIWTAKDISSRTNSVLFQIVCILLSTMFGPVFGVIFYRSIRPNYLKLDKLPWREALLENFSPCYNCMNLNSKDNMFCVHCGEKMTVKCKECSNEYVYTNSYCNDCGAPNIEFET